MAGTAKFDRIYVDFGPKVNDVEKASDVLTAWEDMLAMYSYPCAGQIGAPFSAQWLGEGERPANDPDTLDLLFVIPDTPYIEIILNSGDTDARYGGWLYGQDGVELTDDYVNGYRVLIATAADGTQSRHEYLIAEGGYVPVGPVAALPLSAARRRAGAMTR